jgi:serine/threonine protein phosphatase PrpC
LIKKEKYTAKIIVEELKKWWVGTFFDKHENIDIIKNINGKMNWKTTLKEIKESFEQIKEIFKDDKEKKEVITEINTILWKINSYLK